MVRGRRPRLRFKGLEGTLAFGMLPLARSVYKAPGQRRGGADGSCLGRFLVCAYPRLGHRCDLASASSRIRVGSPSRYCCRRGVR